jgi:hypothetical protein
MNTRSAAALGASLSALFGLNPSLTLGLKGTVSHNFGAILVAEPEALFRWYIPLGTAALFFQADLGASLIFEHGALSPVFLGGLSAGFRFPMGPLFLEPSVRGGYPFIWGAGVSLVYRFGKPGETENSADNSGGLLLRR